MSENIFLSRTNLEAAFRMFDIDNSGAISADELRDVLADGKIVDD